jgi:hypothetical protein
MMNEQARYERARARVQQIKRFYIHLTVYILVNAGLLLLSLLSGRSWSVWPLLGWGIGLVAHAINVFGTGQWFGRDWEEQQIRRVMERDDERLS